MPFAELALGTIITLVLGSYTYTYVAIAAEEKKRESVRKEVQAQATEIKKDLKECIRDTEHRLNKVLDNLVDEIRTGKS